MKRHLLCGLALVALSLPLGACGDDDDDDDNVAGSAGTAGTGGAGAGGAGAGGAGAGGAGAGGATLYCGKTESELGNITTCGAADATQCSKDLCQDDGTATNCKQVVIDCAADAGCNKAVACGAACQVTGESAVAVCSSLATRTDNGLKLALAYQSCAGKVTACGGDGTLDPAGAGGGAGSGGGAGAGGAAAGAAGEAGAGGAAAGAGGAAAGAGGAAAGAGGSS